LPLTALHRIGILAVTSAASLCLAEEPQRADTYKLLRYEEDYGFLKNSAPTADPLDRFKYVPFGATGTGWISWGGELRERGEYYSSPALGSEQQPDEYLLHRVLVHADVHISNTRRAFVQLANQALGDKNGPAAAPYVDRLDIQQAFVDVGLAGNGKLRIGRQEMVFGSQRLVAIRDAPNVRRAFDGLRFQSTGHAVQLDAFVTRPVDPDTGTVDNGTSPAQALWGIHATIPSRWRLAPRINLYYFGFENAQSRYLAESAVERRNTIGTRVFGTDGGWDWDWETALQTGSFGPAHISSWGLATSTGYTFTGIPRAIRVGFKANYSSGDRDAEDTSLGTFNALFPNLRYFSSAGLVAPANVFDVQPTISVRLAPNADISFGYDLLWRARTADAVYASPQLPIPDTAGGSEKSIGRQASVDLTVRPSRHVEISSGYVRFHVGEALKFEDAPSVDFVYVSVVLRL
jgi:hypothetical protein